jgi:hypothetical protein
LMWFWMLSLKIGLRAGGAGGGGGGAVEENRGANWEPLWADGLAPKVKGGDGPAGAVPALVAEEEKIPGEVAGLVAGEVAEEVESSAMERKLGV